MEERQVNYQITQIAVNQTMDPMKAVMDCLFEKKCELFISDRILEHIKKAHSYTKMGNGKEDLYIFHKRARGTDALFSFVVEAGPDGNLVSNLECIISELGTMKKNEDLVSMETKEKVYVRLLEEETN